DLTGTSRRSELLRAHLFALELAQERVTIRANELRNREPERTGGEQPDEPRAPLVGEEFREPRLLPAPRAAAADDDRERPCSECAVDEATADLRGALHHAL